MIAVFWLKNRRYGDHIESKFSKNNQLAWLQFMALNLQNETRCAQIAVPIVGDVKPGFGR